MHVFINTDSSTVIIIIILSNQCEWINSLLSHNQWRHKELDVIREMLWGQLLCPTAKVIIREMNYDIYMDTVYSVMLMCFQYSEQCHHNNCPMLENKTFKSLVEGTISVQ